MTISTTTGDQKFIVMSRCSLLILVVAEIHVYTTVWVSGGALRSMFIHRCGYASHCC